MMSNIKKAVETGKPVNQQDMIQTIFANEELLPKIITANNISKNPLYFFLLMYIALERNEEIATINEKIKIEGQMNEKLWKAIQGTKYLNFEGNSIGNKGMEYVVNNFSAYNNIEHLNINKIGIDDSGIKYVIEHLNQLPNLKELNISDNDVSFNTLEYLTSELKKYPKLKCDLKRINIYIFIFFLLFLLYYLLIYIIV